MPKHLQWTHELTSSEQHQNIAEELVMNNVVVAHAMALNELGLLLLSEQMTKGTSTIRVAFRH